MTALEDLAEHATRWELNGHTIEERWNPKHRLAPLWESNHPDGDKKLYCVLNDIRYVYSVKRLDFVYEMSPSARSDDFILETRFTLDEAVRIVNLL